MIVSQIQTIGMHLAPGETLREICPYCRGGSTFEKSFVVGRSESGRLFMKCYRATCGFKQLLSIDKNGIVQTRTLKKGGEQYKGPLKTFDKSLIDYFTATYGITQDECYFQGWRWAPESNRIFMPIFNDDRYMRGYVLRSIDPAVKPKVITTRINYNEPLIHWADITMLHRFQNLEFVDGVCVIVEDHISAAKVAPVAQSVALMGHFLDYDRIIDIAAGYDHAVLALDDDCFNKSVKYCIKFAPLFKTLKVWKLHKDLKYEPQQRILEALKNGKIDFSELPERQEVL